MNLRALKSKQKKILPNLKEFSHFYLVGGTALALQIGHRVSVDFDLFSDEEISKDLLSKIKRIFRDSEIKILVNHSEQLSVVLDGVELDFVNYKFPLIFDLINYKGVNILPVKEIAAMKAFVLNYRGTLKDYVDLYFILKEEHTSLDEIEKLTAKKYKDEFNFRLFLEQLLYLDKLEDEEIEFLKQEPAREKIKDFFEKEIKNLELN